MLHAELLIAAYSQGYFPMADTRGAREVFWVDPDFRGIIPLDHFHIPRKLRRRVRRGDFRVTADSDFDAVIKACAEPRPDTGDTWINAEIEYAYCELHDRGFAHSIECWSGETLVGGLYGVALGAAFFGESMFSRETDASKVALVHLVARLRKGGFKLLDTQFQTEHLTQFGTIEIPRNDYRRLLDEAQDQPAHFPLDLSAVELDALLQERSQTS